MHFVLRGQRLSQIFSGWVKLCINLISHIPLHDTYVPVRGSPKTTVAKMISESVSFTSCNHFYTSDFGALFWGGIAATNQRPFFYIAISRKVIIIFDKNSLRSGEKVVIDTTAVLLLLSVVYCT